MPLRFASEQISDRASPMWNSVYIRHSTARVSGASLLSVNPTDSARGKRRGFRPDDANRWPSNRTKEVGRSSVLANAIRKAVPWKDKHPPIRLGWLRGEDFYDAGDSTYRKHWEMRKKAVSASKGRKVGAGDFSVKKFAEIFFWARVEKLNPKLVARFMTVTEDRALGGMRRGGSETKISSGNERGQACRLFGGRLLRSRICSDQRYPHYFPARRIMKIGHAPGRCGDGWCGSPTRAEFPASASDDTPDVRPQEADHRSFFFGGLCSTRRESSRGNLVEHTEGGLQWAALLPRSRPGFVHRSRAGAATAAGSSANSRGAVWAGWESKRSFAARAKFNNSRAQGCRTWGGLSTLHGKDVLGLGVNSGREAAMMSESGGWQGMGCRADTVSRARRSPPPRRASVFVEEDGMFVAH